MSQSTDSQLLKREDLPDAKGEWVDKIIQPINSATAALQKIQGAQTGLTGLTNSKIITQNMVHGVELRVKNPFGTAAPTGIMVINSDGYPVAGSVGWRRINSETQPDQLGLTVSFDNSAASTGYAGERIGATISTVTTAATPSNVGSLPLTPGEWDLTVFGIVSASTEAYFVLGLSDTSGVRGTGGAGEGQVQPSATTGVTTGVATFPFTNTTSPTKTYFAVAQTPTARLVTGRMSAQRRRSVLDTNAGTSLAYSANVTFLILGQ